MRWSRSCRRARSWRGMSFSATPGQVVDSEKLIAVGLGQRLPARSDGARDRRVRRARRPDRSLPGRRRIAAALRLLRPAARIDPHLRSRYAAHHRQPQAHRAGADERGAAQRRMRSSASASATPRRSAATPSTIRSTPPSAPAQRYPGIEHWLPFFYDHLDHLAAYTGDAPYVFDDQAREAFADRQKQIADYYEAREQARHEKQSPTAVAPYKPVPPEQLYEMSSRALRAGSGQAACCSSRRSSRRTRSVPTMRAAAWPPASPPSGRRRTSICSRRWSSCFKAERKAGAPHHHRLLVRRLARPHGAGAEGPRPRPIRASPRTGATPRRRRPRPRRWSCWASKPASQTDDHAGALRAGHSRRAPAPSPAAQDAPPTP